ncbi:MAG: signal peptide peptidase SppA [Burkholderiales bacterium]|nr:signal peptide peptidase SppA [Burkholderiales bacterium]
MGLKSALAPVGRLLVRLWGWLDSSRRFVFNLIWLLILVALVSAVLRSGPKPLEDKTTLVLNLQGRLVEQHAGDARERAMAELQGQSTASVQLRDVFKVLEAAAKDSKISQVLLDLSAYQGAGPANQGELVAALERFRKDSGGKKLLAYGEGYEQRGYQVASAADAIYMHPMGAVVPMGYGRFRNYYKDLFERVGVSANVLRVGKYKNFGEPYFANGPSEATLESEAYLYGELWQRYSDGVEAARKMDKGALKAYIDTLPERASALKGDFAKLALEAKLVDGVKTRDEMRALLIEGGAKDEKGHSFRRVEFKDYLARVQADAPSVADAPLAVVVAEGGISDGSAAPGSVGGDSTAALIREARENDKVKALVLRVNSPGGSALASEIIRRELELTRKAGKPVVVSMGDVAASGGYWISMSADTVMADPVTITGSIGVFGMLPTADKLLAKLPVHVGGYGTTWLTGAGDPRRPFDPRVGQAIQAGIAYIYDEFTTKAAAARKTTPEAIDAVAQGRVWTGAQALERKLIDRTGSFADAVAEAAKLAKLEGQPKLRYVEKEPGRLARMLEQFGGDTAVAGAAWVRHVLAASHWPAPLQQAQRELLWLSEAKPQAGHLATLHVHCLCEAP